MFDPDRYLKEKSRTSGFNPDRYLQEKLGKSSSSDEAPGYGESLARGAAQGATLGYADELTGAGEAGLDALLGKMGDKSLIDLYKQHRDESRANYDKAAAANPLTSMAGNLIGGVAPAIATSGLAPAITGVKGAAALGAGLGAVSGYGGSNADSLGGQAADVTSGAVMGGVTGGALQGLANKLNPEALNSFANEKIIKSTGAGKGQMKYLKATDQIDPIDESLFKNKVAPIGASPDAILENSEALKTKAGGQIGDILKSLDAGREGAAPEVASQYFNPANASKQVQSQLLSKVQGEPILAADENVVNKILETINNRGNNPISFQEAQRLKDVLKQAAYNDKGEVVNDMAHQAYGIVNKGIEDAAQDVSSSQGADVLNRYKQAKQDYSAGIQGSRAGLDKTAALMSNRSAGPTDYGVAGIAGIMTGNPVTGVAAGVANKAAKAYGNGIMAHGAKAASGAIEGASSIYHISVDKLAQFGQSLASHPSETAQKLGSILVKAADNDDIGKNALLFSLLQQSSYRELLTGMFK